MRATHSRLLTETIYDAAVDPARWTDVMHLFRREFGTGAEAFYFLDFESRALQPVHVDGVAGQYIRTFRECFYRRDNPFTRSGPLHRPGVIRTDERVMAFLGDPDALRRSQYYNDWMRPQGFAHTMGTTLLADEARILNFTLLRDPRRGTFDRGETRSFARRCGHLARALRIALRVESITMRRTIGEQALDALRHGVVLLSTDGRLLYCNGAAEAILKGSDGVAVRGGRLSLLHPAAQGQFADLMDRLAQGPDRAHPSRSIVVPRRNGQPPLILSAVRLSAPPGRLGAARPCALVLLADSARPPGAEAALLRDAYGLTASEARLARPLAEGLSLRRSAAEAGLTYETARSYVKILFQKTGTHRQADLVAQLLAANSLLSARSLSS